MIIRIKSVNPIEKYKLYVVFDDIRTVVYDMSKDIRILPGYSDLAKSPGLWEQAHLDESRTVVIWNDMIDLPADAIYPHVKE